MFSGEQKKLNSSAPLPTRASHMMSVALVLMLLLLCTDGLAKEMKSLDC